MILLSAVIITKNEEDRIRECLRTLSFCDEIVVIDADSGDKTREIASEYNANVYKIEFTDFANARNEGKSRAKGKWILYIDADERVSGELKKNIATIVSSSSYKSAYRLKRKNFYLGNHEWPYVEKIERLFLKESLQKWQGKLHESPIVEGVVDDVDGFLLHYTHRNITEMLEKTILWSETEARLRLDSGHPKMNWWRFPRVFVTGFLQSYLRQGGWKAGTVGIIESVYQAFSMFITYARLWEMQQGNKK